MTRGMPGGRHVHDGSQPWPRRLLVGGVPFDDLLIFRRQRSLVAALHPSRQPDPLPLAAPVGIFRFVQRLRAAPWSCRSAAARVIAPIELVLGIGILHVRPCKPQLRCPGGRAVFSHFLDCSKYRRSGGGWPFLAGIRIAVGAHHVVLPADLTCSLPSAQIVLVPDRIAHRGCSAWSPSRDASARGRWW